MKDTESKNWISGLGKALSCLESMRNVYIRM